MGYRILPISKLLGLSVNEVYTYFCLLAKTDFRTYVSHVSIETLCGLTGIKKGDTISNHINTLLGKGLIVRKYRYNREMTNTYILYKPEKDFIRIDLELLNAEISPKLKGFLILLKGLCLNNSNYTGYTKTEISQLLHLSRPTLDKFLKECISVGLIKEEKAGFTITDSNLFKIDLAVPTSEHYEIVYRPMCECLISKGVTPPPFNEAMCIRVIFHFSSPKFLVAALKERNIPVGTECSWSYLSKILNVDLKKRNKDDYNSIFMTLSASSFVSHSDTFKKYSHILGKEDATSLYLT